MLDEHILDYRHLRDPVVEASHVLYREGTNKAVPWREEMMGHVWEHGSLVMLDRLGSYLRRHRTGPKQEALESLRDYVGKRVAMTDYPTFRQRGYDCGSGPTESQCGTRTARLKRTRQEVGPVQRRGDEGLGLPLPQRPVGYVRESRAGGRLRPPGFLLAHIGTRPDRLMADVQQRTSRQNVKCVGVTLVPAQGKGTTMPRR